MSNSVHDLSKKKQKIHFTSGEDQIIRNIVAEKGSNCWKELGEILNRKPYSIRNRYNTYLRQQNNDKPWSIEEEQRLIDLMEGELHKKWSKLKQYFPGRAQVQIKNKWNSLIKKLLNEKSLNNSDSTINMHNLSQQVPTDFEQQNLQIFDSTIPNPDENEPFDEDEYVIFDEQIFPTDCYSQHDEQQLFSFDDIIYEDELLIIEHQLIPSPFMQDQIKTEQYSIPLNEAILDALDGPYCEIFPTYVPSAEPNNFLENYEESNHLFFTALTDNLNDDLFRINLDCF
jgi:hypothetical protein